MYWFHTQLDLCKFFNSQISGDLMIYTGKWEKLEKDFDKVGKFEAQVWFGLRELLLNPKCAPYYDITEFRMAQLTKVLLKVFKV